jgi:hypothetical protein
MKVLSNHTWLGRSFAAMALLASAASAEASALPSDLSIESPRAVLGTLPLNEALRPHAASALTEFPAAQSSLLPLPSSFFTLNNPYVLFADVLAMSSSSRQGDSSSGQVFLYDANNNLPVPGPVPLPSPVLLLLCGAGLLLALGRRGGVAAAA